MKWKIIDNGRHIEMMTEKKEEEGENGQKIRDAGVGGREEWE